MENGVETPPSDERSTAARLFIHVIKLVTVMAAVYLGVFAFFYFDEMVLGGRVFMGGMPCGNPEVVAYRSFGGYFRGCRVLSAAQ